MFDYKKYKWDFKEQEKVYNNLIKEYYTDSKKIELLSKLSEEVFDYYKFITKLLFDIANYNKQYLKSLEKITNKLKTDMGQGDFIETLINIGKYKKLKLYNYITHNSKNKDLIEYSGLILGGYLKENRKMITKDLFTIANNKSDTIIKINAILVIFKKEKKLDLRLYDFLAKIYKNNNLIYQYLYLCFMFFNKNKSNFYDKLKNIISKNDHQLNRFIFNRMTFQKDFKLTNDKFYKLTDLVTEYNIDLIDEILSNFKKHNNVKKNVKLILKWFKQNYNLYLDSSKLSWVLDDITKENNKSNAYLDEFINNYKIIYNLKQNKISDFEYKYITNTFYEKIFRILVKKDINYAINKIENIYNKGKISKKIYFKFSDILISLLYNSQKQIDVDSNIIRLSKNILSKFKNKPFLDNTYEKIEKKVKKWIINHKYNNLFNELRILLNIEFTRNDNYNLKQIENDLKEDFKEIYKVFYKNIIKSNFNKQIYTPFFWMLDKYKEKDYSPWPQAYLNELDLNINKIKNKSSTERFKRKIGEFKHEKEFWEIYSEFLFISKFNKENIVSLESVIDPKDDQNKDFDLECKLNNKKMFFEITAPNDPDYWKLGLGVGAIGNRTASIIAKKIIKISDNIVKSIKSGINKNLYFIVIDITNAIDINEYNIENTLYGDLQYTFTIDKKTGNEIDNSHLTRADNGLNKKNYTKFKAISGIIYFKKELDYKNNMYRIKLVGDIISNSKAKNNMDKEDYIKLKKIIFI